MNLAHKIRLYPTPDQELYFRRAAGVARFAYNWGLSRWDVMYQAWRLDNRLPKPSWQQLNKELNFIKYDRFPWMLEVTKCAPQYALENLGSAFNSFFKKKAKYPKFHKKNTHNNFALGNTTVYISNKYIKIPKLGWVRMAEELRFSGRVMSVTISRTADKWFASVNVEPSAEDLAKYRPTKNQGRVGVDLGITTLATLSDGTKFNSPKPIKNSLSKLRRLDKNLSRKKKGSSNRAKAQMKLARLHAKIANIRKDCLHKLTHYLVGNFSIIAIEDLNVSGMMKNHRLARSIYDLGFFEFKRQLQYKSELSDRELVVVDRWFPSSKLCSHCGYKADSLPLSIREWTCTACGSRHDRDLNAAINLSNYGKTAGEAELACGDSSAGRLDFVRSAKLPSVKQEGSSI